MQQSLTATYALNSCGTVQDSVFRLVHNKVIYTEPATYGKVHNVICTPTARQHVGKQIPMKIDSW
jgi:hypothetical protein